MCTRRREAVRKRTAETLEDWLDVLVRERHIPFLMLSQEMDPQFKEFTGKWSWHLPCYATNEQLERLFQEQINSLREGRVRIHIGGMQEIFKAMDLIEGLDKGEEPEK